MYRVHSMYYKAVSVVEYLDSVCAIITTLCEKFELW